MNGWYNGVYIRCASDQDYADPSLDAKRWNRPAIVEIAAIALAAKVLRFGARSDLALNLRDRKKSAVESLHSSDCPE
jgi:hypothetical protein